MKYYIILFSVARVVDVISFDDKETRDSEYAKDIARMPYTAVLSGQEITSAQIVDVVA